MSFNRLVFRALTIAALSKQEGDTHAPTIAGDAVFDTRLDDIEFDGESIEVPLIAVFTEVDKANLLDKAAGRGAMFRTLQLRIDIALGSFSKTVIDGQTQIEYGLPTTDAELEGLLDVFEAQVWRALQLPGRAASDAWQGFVIELISWESMPQRSAVGNNRLAARQLILECRIPTDCRPYPAIGPSPAILPDPVINVAPWLDPMFRAMAADRKYASVLDLFRAASGQPSVYLPQMLRLGAAVNTVKLVEDVAIFAALGRPNGWQTRILTQAVWTAPAPIAPGLQTNGSTSTTQRATGDDNAYVYPLIDNSAPLTGVPPNYVGT